MKNIKMFIFTMLLMLPIAVNAHELKCDNAAYKTGDSFNCYVTTDPNLYDQISGTITPDKNLSCEVTEQDPNLQGQIYGESFTLYGTTLQNKSIVTINCKVVSKPTEGTQAQVIINDFTTHVKDTTYVPDVQVLRSNYVTIQPYIEEPTTPEKDDKPRDVTNIDSTLKLISDPQLNFNFSRIRPIYDIEVLYEVEQLNLLVYPYNPQATFRIVGNQKLEVGMNVIDIYVTSPDGSSTTCYTLNIKRLPRGQTIYYKESDSSLMNLAITGHDIKFESIILEYTVSIKYDVDQLNITPTPTVATANVEIIGNEKLKNGDKITITTTSEDKTSETTYIIHIRKQAPPKDYTNEAIIAVIALVAIAIIILFLILTKREKSDDLLKLKHEKKKGVSKGQKFDAGQVESVEANGELNKVVSSEKPQNISINETNSVAPTQATNVVDTNLNKVTPVQQTHDLVASQAAAPIQVTEPVQVESTIVSGLGKDAPTLDLTNTNVEATIVEPQQEVSAFGMAPVQEVYTEPVVEQNVYQAPVQEVYAQPVVEQPVYQAPVQEVYTQPVVEQPVYQTTNQVVQEPVVTQQYVEPNNNLQDTSILPITPTEYVLPEDQELQATQQMQVVNQEVTELPPIDMVIPPQE